MRSAYYNEHDPEKAAWLRELIKCGLIADGVVDERSILEVQPKDIEKFKQCHFFAGIGIWSYALRQAGWPDERQVWTGSCPCQSFSTSGKYRGFHDPRHLWPEWFRLIRQCMPRIIFGEQISNAINFGWLDLVASDLEAKAYAIAPIVLGAHSIGAPHIRKRLYYVAHSTETGWNSEGEGAESKFTQIQDHPVARSSALVELEDSSQQTVEHKIVAIQGQSALHGFWKDADWLHCRDGRWRPVESGTRPLVDGAAARMVRLRGYGDAIVAPLAQAFIESVMKILPRYKN